MIKVLEVVYQLNQGGIEHVISNLMENMDGSKVEFHFAIISGKRGLFDENILRLGGKIHYFDTTNETLTTVNRNLKYIIDNYGPFNAIHSHVYFFSGYILRIAKQKNIPVRIAHAHDTYKGENRNIKRIIYEVMMRKMINLYSTCKFGVSEEACKHVFGKLDDKTFIINNGIDLTKYRFQSEIRDKKRREFNILPDECLLINVGRFEDQKDHEYLVKVFYKLLKKDPSYKLMLVGKGTLKKKIILMTKRLNIFDKVIFLENRNDINELLMASDIFVMPSKYEGLPLALMEAQAVGVPCVVSDNITSRARIANNVVGLKKENMNLWVNEILKLKNSNKNNFMDNAALLKENNFDIKKIAKFVQSKYLGINAQ